MIQGFETEIDINGEVFEEMRASTNAVLKRLIKDMVEKGATEGKVNIAIGVDIIRQYMQNVMADPNAEDREVVTPKFKYKVSSAMQIKNDIGGEKDYDGMELVWDEDRHEYIIVPIANVAQQSIFDVEYEEYFTEPEIEPSKPFLEASNNLIIEKDTAVPDEDTEATEEYF